MEPNPYSPGSPQPSFLAGRGSELERIRLATSRLSMLGRSGGPLLAFHAPRGRGKTSLLRTAQHEAEAAGFLTAWVTGRDDRPMAADLAQELSVAVQARAATFGDRSQALLHRLDQVQVEFGVPGFKVGARVAAAAERTRVTDVLKELLEDAAQFARNHDAKGLVVFVDEFQEAQLGDRKSLLIALQEFDGAPRPVPVAIVAAGLPSMPSAVTAAATFGERSDFVELGLLRDVAVAEALRLPAQRLGVEWSSDAVETAIELAVGYPYKVQLVGDAAWNLARPEEGDVISRGHVEQAAEEVDRRMKVLFQTRLERTTPEQRRFLWAMATAGEETVERQAIAAQLGTATRALSRPRDELIARGLIEPAGRGRLRFTVPGFGDYVRDQVDADEPPLSAAAKRALEASGHAFPTEPGRSGTSSDVDERSRLEDLGPSRDQTRNRGRST